MVKIMNQQDHKHKEMVEEKEFDESIPNISEISVLTLKNTSFDSSRIDL